jgi:predicted alpha/beta superfamily hydrolase
MRAGFARWFGLLAVGSFVACAASATGGSSLPNDVTPEKGDGERSSRTATVVVHYDTGWGHAITLRGAGAGLSWDQGQAATWTDGNAWTATLNVTAPVELKPLLDDATWSKGPNYTARPGQTVDIWPVFAHDAGRFERIEAWRSPRLDDPRDIVVYLPPSYDENLAERYPVLYMHDGGNLFFDDESFGGVSWDVGGAMDRGFADASIHEAIIVGVYATAERIYEYTPTDGGHGGGGADRYLDFLANELKPEIDRRYRTDPDRDHTGIMGSSLGGLISLDAGVNDAQVFGLIGAVSPSTWWDNTWVIGQVQNEATLPVRIYVDSGDAGDSQDDVTNTKHLADVLRGRGANLDYLVQHGGQHNERYWRQRFPGAAAFLLGAR